jgi:hypothetical protein
MRFGVWVNKRRREGWMHLRGVCDMAYRLPYQLAVVGELGGSEVVCINGLDLLRHLHLFVRRL